GDGHPALWRRLSRHDGSGPHGSLLGVQPALQDRREPEGSRARQAGSGTAGHAGRPGPDRVQRSRRSQALPRRSLRGVLAMTTRREFLFAAGWLGLGGMGVGSVVTKSRAATGVTTSRTIHLEARETKWELAPGKTIRAMAYNGQVPGPTLRAREGERLRVV